MSPFTAPPAIPAWAGPSQVYRLLCDEGDPKRVPRKPGSGRRVRPLVKWKLWAVITPANEALVPAAAECWPLIGGAS